MYHDYCLKIVVYKYIIVLIGFSINSYGERIQVQLRKISSINYIQNALSKFYQ